MVVVEVPVGEATFAGEPTTVKTSSKVILGERVFFGYPTLKWAEVEREVIMCL
jgi:hypothetical protein